MGTFISSNKKLILIASISLFVIIISLLSYNFYSGYFLKTNQNKKTISDTNLITQFPLKINEIGLYSFSCIVENVIYDDVILDNNLVSEVSVECHYSDILNKTTKIIVPIVLKNSESDKRLIYRRVLEGDFSRWNDIDFIHTIEEIYYYQFATDKSIYEKPENLTYWTITERKPTLGAGDTILIEIAGQNSTIFTEVNKFNEDYIEPAKFTREYQFNQYNNFIDSFAKTGKKEELNLADDMFLLPTFTHFISDK
jgi:hypothetical protein